MPVSEHESALGAERQRLEAECNEQAADFSTELEDIASLLASGGPRPDYDALGDALNRIACELAALQPTKLGAALAKARKEGREALERELSHGGIGDEIAQVSTVLGTGHGDHTQLAKRLDKARADFRARLEAALDSLTKEGS